MTSSSNAQWRLAARPVGAPKPSDWSFVEEPAASPADGQFVVENLFLSLDPAMRGWLGEAKSYMPPVAVGDVMRAVGAGRVIESRNAAFPVGAHVTGVFGVQRLAVSDGRGASIVDPSLAPLPVWLGALGLPGLTAYFGLFDVGRMAAGECVVVSGAAGAVGSVVGQIAKARGARVVGIAGGAAKCAWLRELGFDATIDYKAPGVKLKHALREACPEGIDVYFDNVGGDTLDAALAVLARHARVIVCGAISQYNNAGPIRGPANYLSLLVNRASMTGFVVLDYAARYAEGIAALAGWYASGALKTRETTITGLSEFPRALDALFAGENIGKMILAL
ncbi:MAG TPA: NADP-dependent oxidoreductase [Kofleriaceae bacterium]|nr:NADP-dependent oxidoreductase [Kofleriaceae bacterium]